MTLRDDVAAMRAYAKANPIPRVLAVTSAGASAIWQCEKDRERLLRVVEGVLSLDCAEDRGRQVIDAVHADMEAVWERCK